MSDPGARTCLSLRVPRCFRSAEEFCAWNFPMAHKLKTCGCYPKVQRVLVVRSRRARKSA